MAPLTGETPAAVAAVVRGALLLDEARRPRMLLRVRVAGSRRWPRHVARCAHSASTAPQQPPVLHVVVPAGPGASLASLVCAATGLPDSEARALINLGAVYAGSREAPARATKAAAHVAGGASLRIHVRPRRYAAAQTVDWASKIMHRERGLVLVNKPCGLPVTPAVDNSRDCVAACVAAALRCAPLRVIHRLDNCTSGVLALAETRDAAQRFGALQRSAADADDADSAPLLKLYTALTTAPVPLGAQACWVQTGHKAPGEPRRTLVFDAPGNERQHCAQEVLTCAPHAPGVWQVAVRLRTGRTHQIRALLAHCGAAVVGDTLYGKREARDRGWHEPDSIALHACQLELAWDGGERRVFAAPPPWLVEAGAA